MKWLIFVLISSNFVLVATKADTRYRPIPIESSDETLANISDVKILSVKRKKDGDWGDVKLLVNFGITAVAPNCERAKMVSVFAEQVGFENPRFLSDQMVKVITQKKSNCSNNSWGRNQYLSFPIEVAYENPSLPANRMQAKHEYFNTKTLSFYTDMRFGLHRYSLYRLNFKNPANVTLTYEKFFSYSEGRVIQHRPDPR